MASLKTFYCGKGPNRPVATLFRSDAVVVFDRIPLDRLKGRSEECQSVALPPHPVRPELETYKICWVFVSAEGSFV